MATTIKDIASRAGVSHTTVSRALHGHPAIPSHTVERIRKIADEMGYEPNRAARGLKTMRTATLGVIVRRIDDPFFTEVLQGIEDCLHGQGYSLILAASHRDAERERAITRVMSAHRVEGVILCFTQVSDEHRRRLERFRVRTVLINNQATDSSANAVYHDDAYGSHEVTCHLIGQGHTRIAYLGNAGAGVTTKKRLDGFMEAMREAGLPVEPEYIVEGPNGRPQGGVAGIDSLLRLNERPTAVVCYNDMMALGALQHLQRNGLSVPGDMSVTGFDNIELAPYTVPPLTTFNQPKYQLGFLAAQMMVNLLKEEETSQHMMGSSRLVLRGELIERESTSPPNSQLR